MCSRMDVVRRNASISCCTAASRWRTTEKMTSIRHSIPKKNLGPESGSEDRKTTLWRAIHMVAAAEIPTSSVSNSSSSSRAITWDSLAIPSGFLPLNTSATRMVAVDPMIQPSGPDHVQIAKAGNNASVEGVVNLQDHEPQEPAKE